MLPFTRIPRLAEYEVQRDLAILVVLVAACAGPFLGQPFHLDDAFYLDMARNARAKPLYPNDTPYVFEGRRLADMGSHSHPPMQTWFLATVSLVAGEEPGREWVYHVAALIYPLLAVVALYFLAARFVERPIWAALGLAAAPLFLVTQHTLMADVPTVAFWLGAVSSFIWAVESSRRSLCGLAALLLALAVLTSYQAVAVIPLLGFYQWRHGRARAGWIALAAPLAVVAAWFALGFLHYHRFLLADTLGYVRSRQPGTWGNLAVKLSAVLQYQGWLVVFPPFLLHVVGRGGRGRVLALALVASVYLSAGLIPGYPLGQKAVFVVGIAGGTLVAAAMAALGAAALRGRSAALGFAPLEAGFLALWYFGVLAYSVLFLTEGSARYILPLVPPFVIYFVRRLEVMEVAEYRLESPAVIGSGMAASGALVLSLFWGLALAHADAEFARIYPRAARDVARLRPSGDAFFAGEWGFRHYLREAGLRQLPVDEGEVKGGSLVVTPALALPYEIPRGLKSMLVPLETLGYEPATPLRLQDARSHAAFYSTGWGGRLPFSFSTKLLETIEVRQVNLLVEQLPWAAVESAAEHGPWPGYLALHERSPLGLVARPDTRVVYRWSPEARVIFEMACGVSPDAYAPGEDTEFEFEVRQCNAAGAVLAGSSLSLRPGTRERDRDWQPVVLELHSAREGAKTLELRYVSGGGRGIGVFASSVLRKPK